ncbi:MAG: DUF4062 domain-containing protein [Ferruginibacter sp.]
MDKLNVYLSSPYMEFKDIRDKFLTEIKSRNKLYNINAMENYLAIDKDVLSTCINDVNNCQIYVLVLGDRYGSIAKKNDVESGRSFTYWEFDASNKKKNSGKEIERLILLKSGPATADENPLLTAWKKEIAESQIQTVYYNEQAEIPQKILDCLDNFTLQRIQASIQKKDILRDKIFLCNREEINLEFSVSIDNDPIQFFVLSGHEFDLPHYFVKRLEIEYEDREKKWKNINIKPLIPETATEFEKAGIYIKSAIFNELKWKKFQLPNDVTPEGITQYMTENNIDYLSISWFIESALWKNDKLKDFIITFYQKYNVINTDLKTDKRILFFGILRYVPNINITEEQFYEKVKKIQWEHNLPKFSKIKKQDIKDWLNKNEIEDIEMRCEELVSLYLKDIMHGDMYYKDVEGGLQKMLDLYH